MDNNNNDYSIVFSQVQKAYGKNIVINNLNLEIEKGERLILLGPSGCGKTTTLRMIAALRKSQRVICSWAGQESTTLRRVSAILPWCFKAMRCFRI